MTCPCEKKDPQMNKCGANTPPVLKIDAKDCPVLFHTVNIPATSKEQPAKPGDYRNARVTYTDGISYLYDSDGIPQLLSNGGGAGAVESVNGKTGAVVLNADDVDAASKEEANRLQSEIDAIVVSSDVKDVVGTKAELDAYDTSTLSENDIIKVLKDESEGDATTYYRWDANEFTLIGEEGPYYTKSEANTLLAGKQNTLTQGTNITIDGNTISAAGSANIVKLTLVRHKLYLNGVEQHYTDIERLVETEGNYVVVYGDDDVVMKVSAVTSDAVEFATSYISGGEAFVQRVIINAEDEIKEDCLNVSDSGSASVLYDGFGTATDGAMTQNAITTALFPSYATTGSDFITIGNPNARNVFGNDKKIAIGNGDTRVTTQFGLAIGKSDVTANSGLAISSPSNYSLTTASGESSVAIGTIAKAKDSYSVAIGNSSSADTAFSVALGRNANAKATGLVAGSSVGGIAVGNYAKAGSFGVSIGASAGYQGVENNLSCSVALGAYSMPRAAGTVDVSTSGDSRHLGYGGTDYRLITGVHDPVEAQDAATKAYVDAAIAALRTELGL